MSFVRFLCLFEYFWRHYIFGDTSSINVAKKGEPCLFLSINNLYGVMLFYPIAITFFLKRFQCCKKKQIYNKKKTTTKLMTKFNCKRSFPRYFVTAWKSTFPLTPHIHPVSPLFLLNKVCPDNCV